MMTREKQIELLTNAEERVKGYIQTWMKNPRFKAALYRKGSTEPRDEQSYVTTVKKRACA